jgi:uncharacterized SAM-binding protein YcdF (DUF218 family)
MSYLELAFPLFLFLATWGVIRSWYRSSPRERPWLTTIGTVGLLLLSLNPFAWLFSRPLEIWYDKSPIPSSGADAIVVLAGAVNPPTPARPYTLAGHDTYVRVQHAVWLFKHWGPRPVLACGGGQENQSDKQTIRRLLEAEGIPPNMIWIEAQSRSTHENALYGSKVLRQHGISRVALVIDARSMPRAAASFRKQGITVVPAPLQFFDLNFELQDVLPTWRAIESNGLTSHELLGLVWYRLRGWI